MYYIFIDFKNAFYRFCHEALCATMRKYTNFAIIIQAIEYLYNNAKSVILFNGSSADWFRTTVVVSQGCRLSPTLFNISLERIMSDALEHHKGSVSIRDRIFIHFCFADDVVSSEEEEEADNIVSSMDTACTRYKMYISPDTTKIMTKKNLMAFKESSR